MDISDFSDHLIVLVFIVIGASALIYGLRGSLRTIFRVALFCVTFASLASAVIVAFGIWLTPFERGPEIWAPDGKHVALVRYELLGAFGADRTLVRVRHAWSPFATAVYAGARDNTDDPHLQWHGSSSLLVDSDSGCHQNISGVEILCK